MRSKVEAAARLIVALVPVLNIVLVQYGKSPLPFTEEEANVAVSAIVAALATIYAWWKNNNITIEAQTGQKVIDELKANRDKAGGEGDPLEVE